MLAFQNKDLQSVIKAARAGGKVLSQYFGQTLATSHKSMARDFRTKADLESEQAIIKVLEAAFPTYSIFSEERGLINKHSDCTFYIDPLDGTYNFVLGLPYFSISIGLLKNKKAQMGVVYNPILKNLYCAARGQGAFLNGAPISVSHEKTMEKATFTSTCGWGVGYSYHTSLHDEFYKSGLGRLMIMWSPALDLCLLATGKTEAMVVNKVEVHDFAAGKLIAQEAGALITDFQGRAEEDEQNNEFVASNGTKIHDKVVKILKKVNKIW